MTSRFIHLAATALLATACQGPYTVTFNERVLYTPNASPGDNLLADPNLQGCLNQILVSSGNNDPASVTLMACPAAGIETLAGIDKLANLEQLDLSDNGISELSPLASLEKLRLVSLRNNDIRGIAPLMDLPILRFVSLDGNPRIPCRQLDNLQDKVGNSLNRPLECGR